VAGGDHLPPFGAWLVASRGISRRPLGLGGSCTAADLHVAEHPDRPSPGGLKGTNPACTSLFTADRSPVWAASCGGQKRFTHGTKKFRRQSVEAFFGLCARCAAAGREILPNFCYPPQG